MISRAQHQLAGFAWAGYLGKFQHDLTATEPWNNGECIGELSQYGPTFQVSELLSFTQIDALLLSFAICCYRSYITCYEIVYHV